MLGRVGIGLVMAGVITFGLLFLMQLLIATGARNDKEFDSGRIVDFVRVKREETIERKKPKPKKPPAPEQPPPDMPQPQMDQMDPSAETIGISAPSVGADVNISANFGFSASDGEYLPIVKVAPIYPRRAQSRGLEGYVLLEFVVTAAGTVRDPVVIEADPPGVFDRAAMNAALKFKYKPRVIDGEPVEVPGVRNLIRFELQD
jgi:protein TonB